MLIIYSEMPKMIFIYIAIIISLIIPKEGLCKEEGRAHSPVTGIPYGGTLNIGTEYTPTIINPILTTESISIVLIDLIFNSLIRFNENGEVEPDLAESWQVSLDGKVYTFKLRMGVQFHDGTELTSEDVKFTYEKILDPDVNSPFAPSYRLVERFETEGPYIFQVYLKEASTNFIIKMDRGILPEHILRGQDIKENQFNYRPIGTGPFKFTGWTPDNRIILSVNEKYFEGRPYLDRIEIKTYPSLERVWTALMQGKVDLVCFMDLRDYNLIKDDPYFKTFALPIGYYYALTYNLNDPILKDKDVRQALAMGIDRDELIKRFQDGYGTKANGPFPQNSWAYNPNVKPFEYEPDKAVDMLNNAGWYDSDSDGVLEKDGDKLILTVLVDWRDEKRQRLAMLLRQQLWMLGIKLEILPYDDDNYILNEFLIPHNFQTQLYVFYYGVDPDDAVAAYWHSGAVGNRWWGYYRDETDELITKGMTGKTFKERQEVYQRLHTIIYEDQPANFLFFPYRFNAVASKFKGVESFFTWAMPRYKLKDWYLQ